MATQRSQRAPCALNIFVRYEAHFVATKAVSVGWSVIATEAYVFSCCVCLIPPDYIVCVGYERGVILTSVPIVGDSHASAG